jgi:RES domain-containing protein
MVYRSRGTLRAFRIADSRHELFDGAGAHLKGGRWNSPGRRIIYAAQTYAGALLEALVHLNFDEVPDRYGWINIAIPQETQLEEVSADDIPGWNTNDFAAAREYGDHWYEQKRTPVLLVPSVVTAGIEKNILVNQQHPEFENIQAGETREVIWDERLFRR